jgi:hypothetical protein
MNREHTPRSRREFLKHSGRIAAASALASVVIPHVHAAENNTIQVALIGCGGRGTGAAADALGVKNGPVKLVAMADAFQDRLGSSYENLKKQMRKKVDVSDDHKFVGLDAYKNAIDCLKPGDVAIFGTPPGFAGSTSPTPSRRASTSSWRSRSRSMAPPRGRCSPWPTMRPRRTSRWAWA